MGAVLLGTPIYIKFINAVYKDSYAIYTCGFDRMGNHKNQKKIVMNSHKLYIDTLLETGKVNLPDYVRFLRIYENLTIAYMECKSIQTVMTS